MGERNGNPLLPEWMVMQARLCGAVSHQSGRLQLSHLRWPPKPIGRRDKEEDVYLVLQSEGGFEVWTPQTLGLPTHVTEDAAEAFRLFIEAIKTEKDKQDA